MSKIEDFKKKIEEGDLSVLQDFFKEAQRQNLVWELRGCVKVWASYLKENKDPGLFEILTRQGYKGRVLEDLVGFLRGTLWWDFEPFPISISSRSKYGPVRKERNLNSLFFSQVLLLGIDGKYYPGPLFPQLSLL